MFEFFAKAAYQLTVVRVPQLEKPCTRLLHDERLALPGNLVYERIFSVGKRRLRNSVLSIVELEIILSFKCTKTYPSFSRNCLVV